MALRAPASFVEFLRRELAPFPGRGVATARIVVGCVTVLVLSMTLRIPEAFLAVWVIFRITFEDAGQTLLGGVAAVVTITIAIALSLVLLIVALDQPWLRFCLMGATAALAFFLRRTFVIGAAGFLLGLIWTIVLTVPDFVRAPEYVVHFALWLWPVFSLGIAGAVTASLLIAPTDPAKLLREELAKRLESAEDAIARYLRPVVVDTESLGFATSGVARLEALLRSAALVHSTIRETRGRWRLLIIRVDRLVTACAARELLREEQSPLERERLGRLTLRSNELRHALESGLPIADLEHAMTLIEEAVGPDLAVAPTVADDASGAFVADAFTNPEYVHYALKGALAVMICYLLQNAVNWPGIRTCIITCMIVGLTSEGATIQKGTLRIGGAIVGGLMGFLTILFLIPGMESITSLVLVVAAGGAVAAWVCVGSPRISYAGVQIALAFFVCVIQGFGPSWYFYTIRDRLVGIMLGNMVISLVFLSVWPVRAGEAMRASFAAALRAMANLARVDVGGDDRAAAAASIQRLRLQVYRQFAAIQQSADESGFEWSTSDREIAERDRLRLAATEARAIFILLLAAASRQLAISRAVPSAILGATHRINEAIAERLDRVADMSALPDLRTRIAVTPETARAEGSRMSDAEAADAVEGRLTLYRELVPRIDRLASWRSLA